MSNKQEELKTHNLTVILEALKTFREIDSGLSLTSFIHLVYIIKAGSNGITPSELAKLSGIELPTVSRQLTILKDTGRGGKPGHDLIALVEDPKDRRYKTAVLTPKGEELKKLLMEL